MGGKLQTVYLFILFFCFFSYTNIYSIVNFYSIFKCQVYTLSWQMLAAIITIVVTSNSSIISIIVINKLKTAPF